MSSKKKNSFLDKDAEITQAVILADIFDSNFVPITLERPAALFPIINTPVIDYTIEFLASGGIREVIVFSTTNNKELAAHLKGTDAWAGLKTTFLTFRGEHKGRTAGDALREIEERGVIKNDFVLIAGDVVSNLKLEKLLKTHRARREKDKTTLMTMVFKKSGPFHLARSFSNNLVIATDEESGQLLFFDNNKSPKIKFDIEDNFKHHPNISFMGNLIDCWIDICSPEVLALMKDNFDYKDLRHDFVRGVLAEGIYGNIYTYFLSSEYACRAEDPGTYYVLSRDIINRWTFPIVPENNFHGTNYSYSRGDIYIEKASVNNQKGPSPVKLSRTCKISSKAVIGLGTEVGHEAVITNSVIGRNCFIGSKVVIEGSHIWDNVRIESGSVISKSIICDGAVILKNTTIQKGCMVSFKVVVGPNFVLPEGTRLTTFAETIADDNDDPITPTEVISLGGDQKGRKWVAPGAKTNELLGMVQQTQKINDDHLVSDSDSSEEEDDEKDVLKVLKQEVKEIITNQHQKDLTEATLDALIVEIKTRKFATLSNNVEFHHLASAVLLTLLQIVQQQKLDSKKMNEELKNLTSKWQKLFKAYLKDQEDQVEFIYSFQDFCTEKEGASFFPFFSSMLFNLYDNEILDEDSIDKWADENQFLDPPEDKFYLQCRPFLKWLKEAEEEEDDDEDDE